jgi:tetratricopeptide (TPR) repeat protein
LYKFISVVMLVSGLTPLAAQDRRGRIEVENYKIDAEISGRTQSLVAKAAVRFVPMDDGMTTLTFELNNALTVKKVVDEQGTPLTPTRNKEDFTVRVNLPQAYPRGKPVTIIFDYEGHLTGEEDSPVYGIKFASIHEDYAFLLYPARWFPVSGYSTNRFTSEINVTVPDGYKVIGSGLDTSRHEGDKVIFSYKTSKACFPGSIAISKAAPIKNSTDAITTSLYFRGPEAQAANMYGAETAKIMNYFSGLFTIAPVANMTVFETEQGAPNGYSTTGVIFMNPAAIGHDVNARVLANQCSRQWWEAQLSPATRNHLWLENGLAAYSEALWSEHNSGASAMEAQMKAASVEALTVDNVPVLQEARLEDYSPELWALSASKGAEILNMLRYVLGDQKFFQTLKTFATNYAWRAVTTEDFRKAAESVAQEDLKWFFIEWVESSGTPEFKLEYTVFRTQKGFRVQGKVTQDMDTFRMPVELKITTEGNPEQKRVEVIGTSSEFSVDTFGKPKSVTIDPDGHLLSMGNDARLAVAIRKGEQFAEISDYANALKEYQKALETNRGSSLANYRIAEVYFLQNIYQSAANSFRECLNGDLNPKWTEAWAHIGLGKIFDITGQRDRAVNEYTQAQRTRDNTQGAQDVAGKYIRTPYERKKSDGT